MKEIKVFDIRTNKYRNIDKNNSGNPAAVFFDKNGIDYIKENYLIIGYYLINKKTGSVVFIDIFEKYFVVFEHYFNQFPKELKDNLQKYNIFDKENNAISNIFKCLFVIKSFDLAFEYMSPFMKLCVWIMENKYNCLIDKNINIYIPYTYKEFSVLVKNLFEITNINYLELQWNNKIKETIRTIINNYHLNITQKKMHGFYEQLSKNLLEIINGK